MTATPAQRLNPEAARAVGGALALGGGHVAGALLGIVFAIAIPRALGPEALGAWTLFRSLIALWVFVCVLGDQEVAACFYCPARARSDAREASAVFRVVAEYRLGLLLPAMLLAALMLLSGPGLYANARDAWIMAGCVAVKIFQTLAGFTLYGDRLLVRAGVLNAAQAIVLPGAVWLGYRWGGAPAIPPACLLADGAMAVATILAARGHWPGWARHVSGALRRRVFAYALSVSVGMSTVVAFNNLVPYLMGRWGYLTTAIGFFGLGTRCGAVVYTALLTVSAGLMPSLSIIHAGGGTYRMLRWQALATRLGVVLLIGLTGGVAVTGRAWAPLIWGADYAAVTPVLTGCFAALLPQWLASQILRMELLAGRTRLFVLAAFGYGITLLAALFAVAPDPTGWGAVRALNLAAWALYAISRAGARRSLLGRRDEARLALVCLTVAPAAWLGGRAFSGAPAGAVVVALGWGLLLLVAVFGGGFLRGFELRDVWRALRQPGASRR